MRLKLKNTKRFLHEDLIDRYANKGISKTVIYKSISDALGYEFHCADLNDKSDIPYIVSTVKHVLCKLDDEYMSKV